MPPLGALLRELAEGSSSLIRQELRLARLELTEMLGVMATGAALMVSGSVFVLLGGFPASSDVFLAMERGEVEGICESLDSIKIRRPNWIPDKKIAILFQGGAAPNPELKDVPFVPDLARNAEERQAIEFLYAGQGIGRPFVAPPALPPERLTMLRDAFDATMRDPDFLAEAQKSKLEVEPETGAHLAALLARIYATPRPIVDRITNLIK